MFEKNTFKEMLCPICGEFYFSPLEEETDENDLSVKEYREWYRKTISANPDYNFLESQYSPKSHSCPVCGKHTFKDIGSYEICPFCVWIDDPVMNDDPDLKIGANDISLNDYKKRFETEK